MCGAPFSSSRHEIVFSLASYLYYGLRLASEVPLELVPRAGDLEAQTDVTLRLAPVPSELEDSIWSSPFVSVSAGGRVLVQVAGVGRFLIRDGTEIAADLNPSVEPGEVETFVGGPIAAILLHQRGILPLQASAVRWGDRAIAIAGESGHGKSTLAAALVAQGAELLSDDVTAVTFGPDSRASVAHSSTGLSLWPDSREVLTLEHAVGAPIRRGHARRFVRVGSAGAGTGRSVPLGTIVAVEPLNIGKPMIMPASGAGALLPQFRFVSRYELGRLLGRTAGILSDIGRLAGQVRVLHLNRPRSISALPACVDSIVDALGNPL